MKRTLVKALTICGIALACFASSQVISARRSLRRDFLLLTDIERYRQEQISAEYRFALAAGLVALGFAASAHRRRCTA
jgi:hypothetical protein